MTVVITGHLSWKKLGLAAGLLDPVETSMASIPFDSLGAEIPDSGDCLLNRKGIGAKRRLPCPMC